MLLHEYTHVKNKDIVALSLIGRRLNTLFDELYTLSNQRLTDTDIFIVMKTFGLFQKTLEKRADAGIAEKTTPSDIIRGGISFFEKEAFLESMNGRDPHSSHPSPADRIMQMQNELQARGESC